MVLQNYCQLEEIGQYHCILCRSAELDGLRSPELDGLRSPELDGLRFLYLSYRRGRFTFQLLSDNPKDLFPIKFHNR